MVLMNYVKLSPGVPSRMHFTDWYSMDRDIAVPETGGVKRVHSEVFQVDELDGEDVNRTFSIMSQKLFAHLQPFLPDRRYRDYDFIITEIGADFYKDWNVQTIKRPTTE